MKLSEEDLRLMSLKRNEPAWILEARLRAFAMIEKLPERSQPYGLHVMPQLSVGIDELSQKATSSHVLPAAKPYLENLELKSRLDAVHAAFWDEALFVSSAPGSVSSSVIEATGSLVNVFAFAGEDSQLSVVEKVTGSSSRVEKVHVLAAPGAKVRFSTLLLANANVVIERSAVAMSGSSVAWNDVSVSGLKTSLKTETKLAGEGSSAEIASAFLAGKSQNLDINAKVIHIARNTSSSMKIRGALKENARAIVQSNTKILKDAQNSQGHQKSAVLLLGDSARASPIPRLEIDNFDVKASHESSVGQLDRDKLFYMMTRGFSESQAARLVVEGFFEPIISQMDDTTAAELRRAISL